MPGNLLDADVGFPELRGKDQNRINSDILNYLYMLLEQLRYSLSNLGAENFNDTALDELAGLITEPVYMRLQNTEGDITRLTVEAGLFNSRIEDAEGSLTALTQTAEAISGRLQNAEGDITQLTAAATGLEGRISDTEGNILELSATALGLSASVQDLETGMGHTLRLGPDGMTVQDAQGKKVTISNGNLNLSGAITWDDLADGIGDYIDEAYSNASSAVTAASAAASTASSAQRMVDSMTYTYGGRTYIDENMLRTSEIIASKLKGGTVYLLDSSAREIGTMALAYTTYGYGMELATEYGGIRLFSANNLWLGTPNVQNDTGAQVEGAFVQLDNNGAGSSYSATHATIHAYRVSIGEYIDNSLVAVNTGVNLGTSAHPWGAVYAQNGSIQTSDRNKKHDIEPLPERYVDMVRMLEPKRFKMNEGTSGRYHTGFIAQDVAEAMGECGIDSADFGGFVADTDQDGNAVYMTT